MELIEKAYPSFESKHERKIYMKKALSLFLVVTFFICLVPNCFAIAKEPQKCQIGDSITGINYKVQITLADYGTIHQISEKYLTKTIDSERKTVFVYAEITNTSKQTIKITQDNLLLQFDFDDGYLFDFTNDRSAEKTYRYSYTIQPLDSEKAILWCFPSDAVFSDEWATMLIKCTLDDGKEYVYTLRDYSDVKKGESIVCPDCNGKGKFECSKCGGEGTIPQSCLNCSGKGFKYEVKPCPICSQQYMGKDYNCVLCHGTKEINSRVLCSYCDGSGKREYITCYECDGEGYVICSRCNGDGKFVK